MGTQMGISNLEENEVKAIQSTEQELPTYSPAINEIIDILFKLNYHWGSDSGNGFNGDLHWFCSTQYYQVPKTFFTIKNLLYKGYYIECLILVRSILELFAKMRYFNKYPDKLSSHLNNPKRINFKTIFYEFDKDLYDIYYDLLSEAAHGNFYTGLFSTNRIKVNKLNYILDTNFNQFALHYVLVFYISMLYAHLNWFCRFFPKNTLIEDKQLKSKYDHFLDEILKIIHDFRKENPDVDKYYRSIEKLIL